VFHGFTFRIFLFRICAAIKFRERSSGRQRGKPPASEGGRYMNLLDAAIVRVLKPGVGG